MVFASIRLAVSPKLKDAWRLYKLSSYPYLGFIFLMMVLDVFLF